MALRSKPSVINSEQITFSEHFPTGDEVNKVFVIRKRHFRRDDLAASQTNMQEFRTMTYS